MLLAMAFPASMARLFFSQPAAAAQPEAIYTIRLPAAAGPERTPATDSGGPAGTAEPEPGDPPSEEPVTDVLFAGNSLAVGLESADTSGAYSYVCRTGASLPAVIRMVPEDGGHELNVVVMGSNEMGLWSEEKFKASYLELCGKLGGRCACLSVPPVCESKSRYGSRVSNANAALYSGWIEDLCAEHEDMDYLDCSGFFGDSLDPSMTGDGLHLTGKGYAEWLEWIRGELNIG